MKILLGGFCAESNARVKERCQLEDFMIKTGSEVAKGLYINELLKEKGIEAIQTIYGDGRAGGLVSYDAFEHIANRIIDGVKDHLHEIDGIFLFLHGASNVVGLEGGSAEHYILREIRKIVGRYLPIAVVMDPHGNLSKEFADHATIIRTFRHSPHTDRQECHRFVFNLLHDLLKNRQNIKPVYRKVPILLGGERTVSMDEPMIYINKLLDEIESDERILCCSYHVGYVRHDNEKCGAGIIVVPKTEQDADFANQKADEIYDFVFSKRKEFHFTGIALEPEDAIEKVIDFEGSPCFITDSGDNSTAGAPGVNTFILNQFLHLSSYNKKKILFACIKDTELTRKLIDEPLGEEISIELGQELDDLSKKIHLEGSILSKGDLHHHYGEQESIGHCVTFRLKNKPIDIVIAEKVVSFAEKNQYDLAAIKIETYDIIIVKQGYLYPELKEKAEYYVMSLTDGATNQRTEKIKYQTILRPIFPIDDI